MKFPPTKPCGKILDKNSKEKHACLFFKKYYLPCRNGELNVTDCALTKHGRVFIAQKERKFS